MILEGNLEVLAAIKEKKRLVDAAEPHNHIRPALVVSGGLVKGVYGLGALSAFDSLRLNRLFDSAIGVSSGALSLAYFLSDRIDTAISLTTNKQVMRSFVKPFSFSNVMDIGYLRSILSDPKQGFSIDALLGNETKFHIGVSEFATGLPALLPGNDIDTIYDALCATVSMPGAITTKTFVGDTRYVDGESTIPYILSLIGEVAKPTHLLVITNQDQHESELSFIDKFLTRTLYRRRITKPLREAALARRRTRREWIQQSLRDDSLPTCISWGDGSIASFETNPTVIENTIAGQREQWLTKLAI